MNREKVIEKAIKKAKKENPNLENLDNPYEEIADFLPEGGYGRLFPEYDEEYELNSFKWADHIESEIDSIWSRM